MVEDKEPIVMKVLNLAKQRHGIGEGIIDIRMNINYNNYNIKIKTSLEAVSHIGSHIATWNSRPKMIMNQITIRNFEVP